MRQYLAVTIIICNTNSYVRLPVKSEKKPYVLCFVT